jgi:hypothetical protein
VKCRGTERSKERDVVVIAVAAIPPGEAALDGVWTSSTTGVPSPPTWPPRKRRWNTGGNSKRPQHTRGTAYASG